jgi:hypothetical protein
LRLARSAGDEDAVAPVATPVPAAEDPPPEPPPVGGRPALKRVK